MHYESKEEPKKIFHSVSLNHDELKLAVKEAVIKEFPKSYTYPRVEFSKDMVGCYIATVSWVDVVKDKK